jgi:hypothetical protein
MWLVAAGLGLALSVSASAQSSIGVCTSSAAAPTLRSAGYSELAGDIVLTCTGGADVPAGTTLPQAMITVFLNTAITSRLTANGASEALLIVDEPGSSLPGAPLTQLACSTPATGCAIVSNGGEPYDGSPGHPNIFQGQVSGNQIAFVFPWADAGSSAPNNQRILRITNLRVNANGFAGTPYGPNATLSASFPTQTGLTNSILTLGLVQPGLTFRTVDGNGAPQIAAATVNSCTPGVYCALTQFEFKESFANSFKIRSQGAAQNIPGTVYDGESGFYSPGLASAVSAFTSIGLADYGTRLKAEFSNVPSGAQIWVGVSPNAGTAAATLIANESAPFSAVASTTTISGVPAAQIPVNFGSGSAVWEITGENPAAIDSVRFPVWIHFSNGSTPTGSIAFAAAFAPTPNGGAFTSGAGFNASATLPEPRFSDYSGAIALNPYFALAGSSGFTLTTTGSGFQSGAVVYWNGAPLTTTYVNSTQATAAVPSSMITTPSTANIVVMNPDGSFIGTSSFSTYLTPVMSAAVSPASGSSSSQTFTFTFSDSNGAADLTLVEVAVGLSTGNTNTCYISIYPGISGSTLVALASDDASSFGSGALGTAGTLHNSQCTLDTGASSAGISGNQLTARLALSFSPGYAGAKNIYARATGTLGTNTGWVNAGTWNVTGPPQAVSVSPSSGSAASQTFTLLYSDANGASDLGSAQAIIHSSVSSVNGCYVWVTPGSGAVWLAADNGSWPSPSTLGTATTLSNSQCSLNVGSSSATAMGTTYVLHLALTFTNAFAGARNVYGLATTSGGLSSGWQTLGTWTVPVVIPPPQAVSVSPSSGSGQSQTFTFTYSDSAGAGDLASAQAIIHSSVSSVNGCYVWVTPGSGAVWLAADNGTWPSQSTLGSATALSNSQCSLNVGGSSATSSGNTYTLRLALTFTNAFAGARNIYSLVTTSGGLSSNWQSLGTWTVPVVAPPPQAVSVSPSSGSSQTQTFTFTYSDSAGAGDLASAQAIIHSSVSSLNGCYVWVTPGSGAVWLAADNGSWPSQSTLGSATTLSNSQCSLNVGSSSATSSGNTYTLHLALTFTNAFAGARNIYGYATTSGGLSSGWQTLGTWTVPSSGPQAVSVSPSTSSGHSQTFTFTYADSAGAGDLASAQALINSSFAALNGCYVWVTPGSGTVWLAADNASWLSQSTLGTATTLSNSQCSLNVGSSSATSSGNTYTIHLALTFSNAFAGAKNLYSLATSTGGLTSGWQTLGTWTVQ